MVSKTQAFNALLMLILISVFLIDSGAIFKLAIIMGVAGLYYLDDLFEAPEVKPHEPPATEQPMLDPFNTYEDGNMADQLDQEWLNYRSMSEYPREHSDQIMSAFDEQMGVDERAAQHSRSSQMRSKQAIDNRAKMNVDMYRPIFEEDLTTAENLPWWGDNQNLMM